MSKVQNEFKPKFKLLHSFILSCLLTTLLIINSNHMTKIQNQNKLNEEKNKLFNNIIYKRYLEGEEEETSNSGTKTVCDRGSDELKNYYKTGNLKDIKLDEGEIKCEDKDQDYMKALINLLKTYGGGGLEMRNLNGEEEEESSSEGDNGELMDNLMAYGKHIIPILAFIVVAILCIPGWIICCFCCCCNCCCCCCCKKPGCKIPCFIISYAMYALVVVICIYGLSQSNHIFIGLADTECSILKFFDEVLVGESKNTRPKWAGIEGIRDILTNLNSDIVTMRTSTINTLDTKIDEKDSKKDDFLQELEDFSKNLLTHSESGCYKKQYASGVNSFAQGTFVLDLLKEFGTYEKESNIVTNPSYARSWLYEYEEISSEADSQMNNAKSSFSNILVTNTETITNALTEGINTINSIDSTFSDIKGGVDNIVVDYSGIIDEYGKLGVKAVFGILALIDIGIAVFIFLICFCSGKACVKCCCCCRCLFKTFTHLLWNILALLMIIVFIVGSLFSLIGTIGGDTMSLFSYLVSEDNLGDGKETILLGDAKDYVNICINGDGKIEDTLGFANSHLDALNNLQVVQNTILNSKNTFQEYKNLKITYKSIISEIKKRKDLEIEDYKLIRISEESGHNPPYLKLGDLLGDINTFARETKGKTERWLITCNTEYQCREGDTDDTTPSGDFCFHPKNCLPSLRDWVEDIISPDTDEKLFKDKTTIISDMKSIAVYADDPDIDPDADEEPDVPGNTKYFKKNLKKLERIYDIFLQSYINVLNEFNSQINLITSKINLYTGSNGGIFSFINCKFIGSNLKIILKYLKESLGNDLYTVGVCLILVGCSLILAISSTILLIIIINIDVAKKNEEMKNGIPEYPLNNEGRVIRYRN